MNRYVIVDGFPYLFKDGKTYAVKWDDNGYTVGAAIKLPDVPNVLHTERAILAKCANHLNSIDKGEPKAAKATTTKKASSKAAK